MINKFDSNVVNIENNKYNRYNSSSSLLLKKKLSDIYLCENIILSNSGIHANSIAINTCINLFNNNNINIIYPNNLYYENINLIKYFNKNYNCNLIEFDILNNDIIISKFKDNYDKNNILFLESCSNPFGEIFDFNLINKIKKISKFVYIICDNTWLSNKIFNPLLINIDIVTLSLTKYYSGNSGILGCLFIKDNDLFKISEELCKYNGIHNSPIHLDIVLNNINNMDYRFNKLTKLTKKIINYLLKKNIYVIHSYLINHISNDLANEYFNTKYYPSTFAIETNCSKNDLEIIFNKLKILIVSVSFGSYITKIDKNIFTKNNKNYLRISIGYYDNLYRIILGLNELLDYIN
jgi:cystathionine beta-lyase/cystathionine gamma-synthase